MNLKDWFAHYIPQIETEMRDCLSVARSGADRLLRDAALSPGLGRRAFRARAHQLRQAHSPDAVPAGVPVRAGRCDARHPRRRRHRTACTTFRSSTTTSKTTAPRGAGVPRCGRCGACRKPSIRATECSPSRTWRWTACAAAACRCERVLACADDFRSARAWH